MIGIIAKPDQAEAVEEFFELFKTSWEFYRNDQRYDVVVATCEPAPETGTSLLIVYSAQPMIADSRNGIVVSSRSRDASIDYRGSSVPIYGELANFEITPQTEACLRANGRVVGLCTVSSGTTILRIGYDLLDEVRYLLSSGQPADCAGVPTLDIHIAMLRAWIVEHNLPLLEILPTPAGHSLIVCLTHDIDFIGIRNHRFDHTMFGFLYRSTVPAIRRWLQGRISFAQVLRIWRAVVSFPFMFLGWAKDIWEPFEWYLETEKGLPATYFLVPFKRRTGERVAGPHASRRATAYDIGDLGESIPRLKSAGCEIGVHGLDAWHSADKGREELARIAFASSASSGGIRMHWLLQDENTFRVLEESGYKYDSTSGYNETIGFRNGTSQVFRPLGVNTLLELPLTIQDGALFYSDRLDLSEAEAWKRCLQLIGHVKQFGGVLTLLWHDRSHAPERFWGDFYLRLIRLLRTSGVWFGTGEQVTSWFQQRRDVRFESANTADGAAQTCLGYAGSGNIHPLLNVRVHLPRAGRAQGQALRSVAGDFLDVAWNGKESGRLDQLLRKMAADSAAWRAQEELSQSFSSAEAPSASLFQ